MRKITDPLDLLDFFEGELTGDFMVDLTFAKSQYVTFDIAVYFDAMKLIENPFEGITGVNLLTLFFYLFSINNLQNEKNNFQPARGNRP